MSLYEDDFYAWVQSQIAVLQAQRWGVLDVEHLVEELGDLGRSERRAMESYVVVVLRHLLKWTYQPARRGRSWQLSLVNARYQLRKRLRESPSLGFDVAQFVAEGYAHARHTAAIETGLDPGVFPTHCPWTWAQIQDQAFLPAGPP